MFKLKELMLKILLVPVFIFAASLALPVNAKDSPDLVILNAKIYTAKGKKVRNGGIAIKNGRIIAVDRTYKIRDMMIRGTKRVDARGRLVVPGFNDSHTHFMAIGNLFSSINLKNVRRPAEVSERLRHYSRFLPKGRWIQGGNWNNSDWAPNSLPTKELLDAATPDNPVFLYGNDPNIAVANSLALKIAGIRKNSRPPQGGKIMLGADGEPNGILRGTAVLLVKAQVPRLATKELLAVAETATNYAASLGVTSVQDVHSDYVAEIFRELRNKGKLKTRIYDCGPLYDWEKIAKKGIRRASGDEFVREGCLKSFSVSSKDAAEELYEDVLGADKAGLQIMVHAIGGSSVNNIINIYERVEKANGRRDRRFRVEHATRYMASDMRRFARLSVIPSLQPHLFGGREQYRSLLESKARIAFGSDASITDFNPILGIYAAVNRAQPRERLTVEQALRLYTIGSAYAEFQEDIKGTIEKGKVADLVILSENLFAIPKSSIRNVVAEMTFMNGEIVYDKRNGN
jgi:predicted amidohydrolase YtcJ